MSVREVVTVYNEIRGPSGTKIAVRANFLMAWATYRASRVTGRRAILTPDNEGAQRISSRSFGETGSFLPWISRISSFDPTPQASSFKYSGCPMYSFSMILMGPRLRSLCAT